MELASYLMASVHHVNWLRAKVTFDRANEEETLVQYEMKWTTRYFEYYSRRWRERKESANSPGHVIYAARQEAMWQQFATAARHSFNTLGVET